MLLFWSPMPTGLLRGTPTIVLCNIVQHCATGTIVSVVAIIGIRCWNTAYAHACPPILMSAVTTAIGRRVSSTPLRPHPAKIKDPLLLSPGENRRMSFIENVLARWAELQRL